MPNRTEALEERVHVLERLMHRLLLVVGASSEMLAEVRRPLGAEEA
jgi:hypothetical protein